MGEFMRWRDGSRLGWVVDDRGCHIWTGARDRKGYAMMNDPATGRIGFAHRLRYVAEVGPVPNDMILDHFACDNGPGGCCNPHHCRPVTHRENLLRGETVTATAKAKTHCIRGHELAGDNLDKWHASQGRRKCMECNRLRDRARRPSRGLRRSRYAARGA